MANVAIITARGGSKRIPKKNIKIFLDKPIIAYGIEAALNSNCFEEVMVSTDSEEIAEVARRYGARVPFLRSDATASDNATTSDSLLEVLSCYKDMGREFEFGCCIYPTAPFITGEKLQSALQTLVKTGADTVAPFVAYSYPPQRGFLIRDQHATMKYPEFINSRTQDLETIYHDSGQFYFFRVDSFGIISSYGQTTLQVLLFRKWSHRILILKQTGNWQK